MPFAEFGYDYVDGSRWMNDRAELRIKREKVHDVYYQLRELLPYVILIRFILIVIGHIVTLFVLEFLFS